MSRKDQRTDKSATRDGSGDEDSTNLVKRLTDNQPLSDTDEIGDERRGERRQYGMHAPESPSAAKDEPDVTRGSDG